MPVKIDNLLSWASDIEDGTLEQAAKTSRLPFLAGPVALMPDAHVGIGSTVGSVIPTVGAIVPAAVGVDIGCFRGDTKIPLLNGTQKSLQQMTEEGGEFWVYSVDESGNVVPGKAIALQTRSNAALIRIVISGGEEIICTPDHQFMLSDGTYKEAQYLRFNESLMPLYRWWQTCDGYESVSTGKGHSGLTHLLVYEVLNGPVPSSDVVHHADHNHFNNDPSNLQAVDAAEHSRHHRRTGHSFPNDDPAFQERRIAGITRANQSPERQEQMARVGTQNILAYMNDRPEEFRVAVSGNGQHGGPALAAFNVTPRVCSDCGEECPNPASLRWHKDREHSYNHKVISVETLVEHSDVYCLQVEDHHNFALAAGVFVHNCGMAAMEMHIRADQLPDDLGPLHGLIRDRIPAGVGKGRDKDIPGAGRIKMPYSLTDAVAFKYMDERLRAISANQLGTLGSGNHFVEVCLDENEMVWVVLHSGSRGVGNKLAQHHIGIARGLMKSWFIELEDPDLAYLVQGTPQFDAYIADMLWAQDYALSNRAAMLDDVVRSVFEVCKIELPDVGLKPINCHHNYTTQENHHGKNMWLTRKGAISARKEQRGIIPGSMGTSSYIVRGLGNEASYQSCSHGAGRRMSRGQARRELTVESLREQMAGKTWNDRQAGSLLDEHPASYKDIDVVMRDQADLVEIEHSLTQILNYKGT